MNLEDEAYEGECPYCESPLCHICGACHSCEDDQLRAEYDRDEETGP